MTRWIARKELPALIDEIGLGINYLLWLGGFSNLQASMLDEIRFRLLEIREIDIGFRKELDEICYDLDELANTFWQWDPRQTQCWALIDEIQDFQLAATKRV